MRPVGAGEAEIKESRQFRVKEIPNGSQLVLFDVVCEDGYEYLGQRQWTVDFENLTLNLQARRTDEERSDEWREWNDGIVWQRVDEVTEDGYYLILGESTTPGNYYFLCSANFYGSSEFLVENPSLAT